MRVLTVGVLKLKGVSQMANHRAVRFLDSVPMPAADDASVAACMKRYLTNTSGKVDTHKRITLDRFAAAHESMSAVDLRPEHLETFLDAQESWNAETRKRAGWYIVAALGANVASRVLTCNPLEAPSEEGDAVAADALKEVAGGEGTVGACYRRWIDHIASVRPRSLQQYRCRVQPFARLHRDLTLTDVHPRHVFDWVTAQDGWNPSTRCNRFTTVKMMFRFNALHHGVPDPLSAAMCPPSWTVQARGPEYVLERNLIQFLIRHAEPALADVLRVLANTGARPGEVVNAEAWHLQPGGYILFKGDATRGYLHKTARRRRGRAVDRKVFLDAESLQIARRNGAQYGWLFPSPLGRQFRMNNLAQRFDRLKQSRAVARHLRSLGREPQTVLLYSFRHTYITRCVGRGIPIKTIADLCGTSVKMIEEHYSHAFDDDEVMGRQAAQCLDAINGNPIKPARRRTSRRI